MTTDKDLGPYAVLDCGAFVTAFMLAAHSLGIASIAQASIAGRAEIVRQQLDIPEDRDVVCAISFGKADPQHPANQFRTGRAPEGEAVSWQWS